MPKERNRAALASVLCTPLSAVISLFVHVGFDAGKKLNITLAYIDCAEMQHEREYENVEEPKIHNKEHRKERIPYEDRLRNARNEWRLREASGEADVIP